MDNKLASPSLDSLPARPGLAASTARPGPMGGLADLFAVIGRERWLLVIFVAALAVRLHWNLVVHPPLDYVYSDMGGYVSRATGLVTSFWRRYEYAAFYPFGTHWLVGGVMALFGTENGAAIGATFASLSAFTVAFSYAAARRASRYAIVPAAVGLLGIFYYPQLSQAGYVLSETPFGTMLAGFVLCSVRLADEGKSRDAWLLGLCAGLGALFRPQILISVAFLGIYWIVRRKALPAIRVVHVLQAAIPFGIVLALAMTHLHYHTGRLGMFAENGSFNLVFGRCHNRIVESLPDGTHGKVHFQPPPLLQVGNAMNRARKAGKAPEVDLDPAFEEKFSYRGYIGDREQHMAHIARCIEKTGLLRQLGYSWINVNMMWRFNNPWPDAGAPGPWNSAGRWWMARHREWLAIPSLLGLVFLGLPRRCGTVKLGLIAVNLLAILTLSAVFFGDPRLRAPYDFVIITLAFEVYATGALFVYTWGRRLWSVLRAR